MEQTRRSLNLIDATRYLLKNLSILEDNRRETTEGTIRKAICLVRGQQPSPEDPRVEGQVQEAEAEDHQVQAHKAPKEQDPAVG